MFTCFSREPRPAQITKASPLLSFLAGEFAERVAGRWPEPHAVFLTASSARRHLVCLALASGGPDPVDLDRLLHAPLQRAVKLALDRPVAGLARALGRLGERAWTARDYLSLIELLAEHHSAKLLRHASEISPESVRSLLLLPAPLRNVGLGRLNLTPDQAALVAEACAALANHGDPDSWSSAPSRWSGSGSVEALLEHIRNDLYPELPVAPFCGSARLAPLTTREQMTEAALRYRNCLRSRIHNAVGGWSEFFEWKGEPGAIVEIYRDPLFGWRFDEARLAGNEVVSEPMRSEILAELRQMGVHVGRSDWELDHALEEAAKPGFKLAPVEAQLADRFGD